MHIRFYFSVSPFSKDPTGQLTRIARGVCHHSLVYAATGTPDYQRSQLVLRLLYLAALFLYKHRNNFCAFGIFAFA